jgi:myo-inositol 2-dehydrogenase / D-chiro-inositol 1-dehydrogenase
MAKCTRRAALAGAAASWLIVKPGIAFGSQANSAVSFGIIGTGGRGQRVGGYMSQNDHTRLTAICDIYPDVIEEAKEKIPGVGGAAVHKDYHDLLARNDIDAVLISTPAFLHPEHFEAAVQAGKHIYCEKPAAVNVAGAKRILRAGEQADSSKTIQFGFQQRFSREYLAAEKILRDGKVGDVKVMASYWVVGGAPRTTFKSPYPLEEQKIRHWYYWTDLSGGPIVEQDCHGIDVMNWFADARPLRAVGSGFNRYTPVYGDRTSDHHNIIYTYPDDVQGWMLNIKGAPGLQTVHEDFYGSVGALVTSRNFYEWRGTPKRDETNVPRAQQGLIERVESKRDVTIDATDAFFASIMDGKHYNMSAIAAESTMTAILGRMVYEFDREVTWDEMFRSA